MTTVEELNVTSLVQMLDENHKSDVEVVTTYDTSAMTNRKVNPDVQFSEEELDVLFDQRRLEPIVTKEKAIADTETLMRLLESSYGGYDYFGGKERFNQAKEAIINRVKENDKFKFCGGDE